MQKRSRCSIPWSSKVAEGRRRCRARRGPGGYTSANILPRTPSGGTLSQADGRATIAIQLKVVCGLLQQERGMCMGGIAACNNARVQRRVRCAGGKTAADVDGDGIHCT